MCSDGIDAEDDARVQARTLRRLDGHDFYGRTRVSRDNVRLCRIRSQKRQHCEELRLTHFVDDRVDVHHAIHGTVEHQYLFGHTTASAHAHAAETWADVLRLIEATVAARATMDA